MKSIDELLDFLKQYDGEKITLMEVCGTHTGAIASLGLRSILSPKISLVSGPGCPVCVTVSQYIDKLCALSALPNTTVVTFGDMLRVKGSQCSLQDAASVGSVQMVYSPFEIIELAQKSPDQNFVFAAVGFETTTPIYAIILDKITALNLKNVKLLTSLKTMPAAINWICKENTIIDGFIAPGHVSVVTGSEVFQSLSQKYNIPFAVAGFDSQQILAAIYTLIKCRNRQGVYNLYRSAVKSEGNQLANALVSKYFAPCDASWRGLGTIASSGLCLRPDYLCFDSGSCDITKDLTVDSGCICSSILTGKALPTDCPLFVSGVCTPENPRGACMVSQEGCCNCFKRGMC